MTSSSIYNNNDYIVSRQAHTVGVDLTNSVTRSIAPLPGTTAYDVTTNLLYVGTNSSDWQLLKSGNTGNGDVVGPSSSTDNALARFDGTGGKTIQNSLATLSDAGNLVSPTFNGGTLGGNNSGDVTIGAIGSTPNANAASLTGQALVLQPADGSFGGVVTTATQTFAGVKTLSSGVALTNLEASQSALSNNPVFFQGVGSVGGSIAQLSLSAGGASALAVWHLQKVGRQVFIAIGDSALITVAAPNTVITAPAGSLPAEYRPTTGLARSGLCRVANGGTAQIGYVTFDDAGGFIIYSDPAYSLGFTTNAQTFDFVTVIAH